MNTPDYIAHVKQQIREITPERVSEMLRMGENFYLIDVREAHEIATTGVLPNSIHIPRGELEFKITEMIKDPHAHIVVCCAAGSRSALAAKLLQDMGFQDVSSLAGGIVRWKTLGLPLEQRDGLTSQERERYARHLSLPEIGEVGQIKLKRAKVLIVGAGGLGSPASIYLAAAGVGYLGIVDHDVVDRSNLQRQVLHTDKSVGMSKVASAKAHLTHLNPHVQIQTYEQRLTEENAQGVMSDFDVIVNGSDNFPTRYLVNDTCVLLKKPLVDAAIHRYDAQLTVYDTASGTPCYRCLFPQPPAPDACPNCQDAGVLGVLPGIIGTMQALEVLKLIVGFGTPLRGTLLTYNACDQDLKKFTIKRRVGCLTCGGLSDPCTIEDSGG